GTTFVNKGLVGVGRVPASLRDRLGETFGSLSGLAVDSRTWRRNADSSYSGSLYAQPDRGTTRNGSANNYAPRRHRLSVSFLPAPNGATNQLQLGLTLTDTTLYTEANGTALTSLDPSPTTAGTRTGFPALPQASNNRIALDAEGIALLPDGSFFLSDEYGPYLYRFSAAGVLLNAIRPPEALIPKRGGRDSFSADNAASGQPSPSPSEPTTGRENNQGFEGLTVSGDGRTLYALMQSATRQDGGAGGNSLRRYTRLLAYDISNPTSATLRGEWILPLPIFTQAGVQQVASVGDIAFVSGRHLLVLARDGNGRGSSVTSASLYRAVLIYDLAGATNIAGTAFDTAATPVAPNGVLASSVTPATSTVLLDLNDLSQLVKFGLNNSAADNSNTLSEKWESLAIAPALDPTAPDDFFVFVGNDNDFSTNDGFQGGSSFSASPTIDSMILVYRVSLATRLINISSRSLTGAGGDSHIVGFVVQGARARSFVVRGIGPGLAAFGVPGTLPDPVLQIFDDTGKVVLTNDNWNDGALAADLRTTTVAVGGFALQEGSKDAALLVTLDPGRYTVNIADVSGRSGVSLAEVYEVP
ncbi:MAG: esterase-like activity of phytase family protein, partial [Opitutaceae bacterium]